MTRNLFNDNLSTTGTMFYRMI